MDRTTDPKIYQFDYLALDTLKRSLREAIEKYESINHERINLKVLDIGCGSKPYSSFFSGEKTYIGIDLISNKYVDCRASAENLPFQSESFDIIISTQMLEHVKHPTKVVKEINRVLKIGGVVFLSAPGIWEKHGSPHDYWRWMDNGLKLLFSDFQNVEVIECGGSISCFFQLLNLYIRKFPRILKPILYLISNLIGKKFDNPMYTQLVINYLVIAEKRAHNDVYSEK